MIIFAEQKGPRCFVQVGAYEGRNKRTKSVFRVVHNVDLAELKTVVEKAVNDLAAQPTRRAK